MISRDHGGGIGIRGPVRDRVRGQVQGQVQRDDIRTARQVDAAEPFDLPQPVIQAVAVQAQGGDSPLL